MRRVVLAAVAALVLATPVAAAPAPRWRALAPMKLARTESAYAVNGGKVYAIGGLAVSLTNTTSVEVYDVARNTWSEGPLLPVAVNHAMGAAIGGRVYVVGGYSAVVFGALNTAFVLNDGFWQPIAPMPETRAAGAMVAYGGKLHVLGGFTQQAVLATTTLTYDPVKNDWSTGPGIPTPREHLSAVSDGRHVWTVGGRSGSPSVNHPTVERYDVRARRWTALPGLLTARSGHVSALTSNGLLVSAGGESPSGVFDSVEAFHVASGRRVRLPALDPGRTGFGGVADGTRFLVFSGATASGYLARTEVLDVRRV